jgi:hypothetical protein
MVLCHTHNPISVAGRAFLFSIFLFDMLNIQNYDQMWRLIFIMLFRTQGTNNRFSEQVQQTHVSSVSIVYHLSTTPYFTATDMSLSTQYIVQARYRILKLTKIQAGSYIYPCNSCIFNHQIRSSAHNNASSSKQLKGLIDHGQLQAYSPRNPRLCLLQCCSCCSRPKR